ncbi:MAG TPA: sugar transferase [Rhodocyclaceae bacterium]|nr:sugar transferase [Rhodocyclaceae bacterium]
MNATPDTSLSDLPAYRTAVLRRMLGMSLSWRHPLSSAEALLDPVAIIGTLWLLVLHAGLQSEMHWWWLSALLLILTYPAPAYLRIPFVAVIRSILAGWLVLALVLIGGSQILSFLTGAPPILESVVLRSWLWLAPLMQLGLHALLRCLAPMLIDLDGSSRVAVIAGAGDVGSRLGEQLRNNPYGATRVMGFFDDRHGERIDQELPILGPLTDLPAYIAAGNANVVYITLPLSAQSRIGTVLENLRHTDTQVYYVPDALVADLLRGWCDVVGDAPVVAMLESPFASLAGVCKRLLDIVLASLLLVLVLPVLAVAGIAVKLVSRGPAFVVQHRFGLDGREILLYALRATEPGPQETELGDKAPPNNKLGRLLRRTQIEKLPRLVNVIQGRLSLVGPRPHAKAHNEIYRRIVKGHLVRHRVRSGITGWAQINGVRGGEKSLDHMKARVSHDLEYLRHWSLRLDLQIMLRALANLFTPRR